MGPRDSYICLIPKPLENIPPLEDDDSDADVTPARSWSLLQPLAGTCLYVCLLAFDFGKTALPNANSLLPQSTAKAGSRIRTATTTKSDNLKN